MYILGNPILGLNFRHHNKHLLLNYDGLFYVNEYKDKIDKIFLTNDYRLILDMMEFDMSKNYNVKENEANREENMLLVMEELEKSPRFYRTLFIQNTIGYFNELYYVSTFKTYLRNKNGLTERTFKQFTQEELVQWFPFLIDAIIESNTFLKNEMKVYKAMTGSVLKTHHPNITNEEIGQVMTQWNDLPNKMRVMIFLANPIEEIIKELINPE